MHEFDFFVALLQFIKLNTVTLKCCSKAICHVPLWLTKWTVVFEIQWYLTSKWLRISYFIFHDLLFELCHYMAQILHCHDTFVSHSTIILQCQTSIFYRLWENCKNNMTIHTLLYEPNYITSLFIVFDRFMYNLVALSRYISINLFPQK